MLFLNKEKDLFIEEDDINSKTINLLNKNEFKISSKNKNHSFISEDDSEIMTP